MHTTQWVPLLNTELAQIKQMLQPIFVFVTGASGIGKTTITTILEQVLDPQFVRVAYFDRIGVPSEQEMIARYGSGKQWQEAKTYEWVEKLITTSSGKKLIIFEGQYDPDFAVGAAQKYHIEHFLLIGIYAQQTVREARLIYERKQPELANQDMENWPELLKNKVLKHNGIVIDTTSVTPQEAVEYIAENIVKNL